MGIDRVSPTGCNTVILGIGTGIALSLEDLGLETGSANGSSWPSSGSLIKYDKRTVSK
jgi:hypothetical protein